MDRSSESGFESLSGFCLNRRPINIQQPRVLTKYLPSNTAAAEEENRGERERGFAGWVLGPSRVIQGNRREGKEDRANQFPFLVINFRFDLDFGSFVSKSYN